MSDLDCDWSEHRIGRDRYRGTVAAAIWSYQDIPAMTRAKLIVRMSLLKQFDEVVEITNDTPLFGMHYGNGRVCESVRRQWRKGFTVMALRFTVDGHTVLYPSACGNVVRTRWTSPVAAVPAPVVPEVPAEAVEVHQVPEPSSLALAVAGLVLLALRGRVS